MVGWVLSGERVQWRRGKQEERQQIVSGWNFPDGGLSQRTNVPSEFSL